MKRAAVHLRIPAEVPEVRELQAVQEVPELQAVLELEVPEAPAVPEVRAAVTVTVVMAASVAASVVPVVADLVDVLAVAVAAHGEPGRGQNPKAATAKGRTRFQRKWFSLTVPRKWSKAAGALASALWLWLATNAVAWVWG